MGSAASLGRTPQRPLCWWRRNSKADSGFEVEAAAYSQRSQLTSKKIQALCVTSDLLGKDARLLSSCGLGAPRNHICVLRETVTCAGWKLGDCWVTQKQTHAQVGWSLEPRICMSSPPRCMRVAAHDPGMTVWLTAAGDARAVPCSTFVHKPVSLSTCQGDKSQSWQWGLVHPGALSGDTTEQSLVTAHGGHGP